MMSGHCRLESFGGGGLVNGTESHRHDKGDLWTLDIHSSPWLTPCVQGGYIEKGAFQCYFITHDGRKILLSCRFIYQSS